MKMHIRLRHIVLLVVVFAIAAVPLAVSATNSWGGYHWARTSNPFTLKLGDNLSSTWDPILATTSSDWSQSTVLDTTIVSGQAKGSCSKVTKGRVEVCNKAYGFNGWLGVAGIWVSGSHITQGYVKVNDSYFNTATYNTTAWRNLVMCQEVGHTLGLAHQDEDFNNEPLGTCMDYTSDPTPNQHPNQHDYDQLALIYEHLDSTTTLSATAPGPGASAAAIQDGEEWGAAVQADAHGRPNLFVKDLGGGQKKFTWVFWTAPGKP
ncbi:MAG: hypothetical protein HYU30_06365 [Chloroflexi bacterium]|nr:hypothetical protein [Chloroflexota bacterium]